MTFGRRSFPALTEIHTVAFDFDGVFTDNKVWINEDGCETVRCDRADGLAFDLVRAFRRRSRVTAEFFILSKETSPVVIARAQKLRVDCHHGIGDKLAFMVRYLATRLPDDADPFAGLVYLGNDLNDLPLMRRARYSVAPLDAHPLIINIADLILERRGGEGFVRAFIDRFLGINQLTIGELDELISDC